MTLEQQKQEELKGHVKKIGDIFPRAAPIEMPEQDIECPKHGIYRGKPMKSPWINHDFVVFPECPKCQEEELEKKSKEKTEKKRLYKTWKLQDMNIGERYLDSDFANFIEYSEELKHHRRAAENFAINPDGKLVMLGSNGTGKTHLAVSILKITGGKIYTAFEISVMLRQSYKGDTHEWKILKDLCAANTLVIDEIGRSKGSDWDLNWLSHVINKRHENIKPTVLISNRHLRRDCPEGSCSKCLEEFFDNDVISRIIEDGMVLKFTGEDYRKRIGEGYRKNKNFQIAESEKWAE